MPRRQKIERESLRKAWRSRQIGIDPKILCKRGELKHLSTHRKGKKVDSLSSGERNGMSQLIQELQNKRLEEVVGTQHHRG